MPVYKYRCKKCRQEKSLICSFSEKHEAEKELKCCGDFEPVFSVNLSGKGSSCSSGSCGSCSGSCSSC